MDKQFYNRHRKQSFNHHRPKGNDLKSQKFHSFSSVKLKQNFSNERRNGHLNFSLRVEEIPYGLAYFKEHPTIHPASTQRPFHGMGCKCLPFSSKDLVTGLTTEFGLRNLLCVSTMNPNNYFVIRRFYYLAFCLNIKTNFNYSSITNKSILKDHIIQETIETNASEEIEDLDIEPGTEGRIFPLLISQQMKKAHQILENMKASLSSVMIRITGYVLFKVFSRLFSSVIITEGQVQMIQTASESNIPLIFMPLHRSHVDYLLVTWVLFNRQISAPLVAAGDNLRIPVFGWVLRSLGGFFIKRKLQSTKDREGNLYRSVLQAYMNKCLSSGYNLEFFIEGGRTRTGKPLYPKGGLLSIIVDAFVTQKIDDALIIPISINYDKLVDGDFSREQLGQKKIPESFWRTVIAIKKVFSTSYGHTRIDFSQPFSLKEFFQTSKQQFIPINGETQTSPFNKENPKAHHRSLSTPLSPLIQHSTKLPLRATNSSSSLFGKEEYRSFVAALGQHVIYDGERCQALMSTNVVAWLLSFAFRDGTTLSSLSEALSILCGTLKHRKRDTGFSGDHLDVVIHAIKLLGESLILVKGDLDADPDSVWVAPQTSIPSIITLNYYSNAVLPLFALDAIVVTALFAIVGDDLNNYKDVDVDWTISGSELFDKSKRLCEILQNEFVLVPSCQKIESKIYETIDELTSKGLLSTKESMAYARRVHLNPFEDGESSSESEMDTFYKLRPKNTTLETYFVWTRALAPLIESYYATACNLSCLLDHSLPQKDFVDDTQTLITTLLERGTLLYGECIAAENIKNALSCFKLQGLLELYCRDSLQIVSLTIDYDSEEKLFAFIKEIEEFKL